MTDYMTKPLADLATEILEDGIIDAEEVKRLRRRIYEDDIIDREEADFLFELNENPPPIGQAGQMILPGELLQLAIRRQQKLLHPFPFLDLVLRFLAQLVLALDFPFEGRDVLDGEDQVAGVSLLQ